MSDLQQQPEHPVSALARQHELREKKNLMNQQLRLSEQSRYLKKQSSGKLVSRSNQVESVLHNQEFQTQGERKRSRYEQEEDDAAEAKAVILGRSRQDVCSPKILDQPLRKSLRDSHKQSKNLYHKAQNLVVAPPDLPTSLAQIQTANSLNKAQKIYSSCSTDNQRFSLQKPECLRRPEEMGEKADDTQRQSQQQQGHKFMHKRIGTGTASLMDLKQHNLEKQANSAAPQAIPVGNQTSTSQQMKKITSEHQMSGAQRSNQTSTQRSNVYTMRAPQAQSVPTTSVWKPRSFQRPAGQVPLSQAKNQTRADEQQFPAISTVIQEARNDESLERKRNSKTVRNTQQKKSAQTSKQAPRRVYEEIPMNLQMQAMLAQNATKTPLIKQTKMPASITTTNSRMLNKRKSSQLHSRQYPHQIEDSQLSYGGKLLKKTPKKAALYPVQSPTSKSSPTGKARQLMDRAATNDDADEDSPSPTGFLESPYPMLSQGDSKELQEMGAPVGNEHQMILIKDVTLDEDEDAVYVNRQLQYRNLGTRVSQISRVSALSKISVGKKNKKLEPSKSVEKTRKVQTKARKERDQVAQAMYLRERDTQRDWLRRFHLGQGAGEMNSTFYDSKVTSQQNNYSQLSLYKPKRDGNNAEQKDNSEQVVVNDAIIFQSHGRDTYFKRACLRKKESEGTWVENTTSGSNIFTVKWHYHDSSASIIDYNRLKPHQLFNHFRETRELTTKQGITKNLNSITKPGVDVSQFFPRSYDLSDKREIDLWIADFNQTAILNVLQKHAEIFELFLAQQSQAVQEEFQILLEKGLELDFGPYSYDKHAARMEIKRKLNKIEIDFGNDARQMGYINTSMVEASLFYTQNLLNETLGLLLQEKQTPAAHQVDTILRPGNHDEFFKRNAWIPEYRLPSSLLDLLMCYSALKLPLKSLDCLEASTSRVHQKLRKSKGWAQLLFVDTNITYLMYLTLKQQVAMELYWPQYGAKSVNGSDNVWICKPSYNARGLGIFCFNQKEDIINTFSKKAPAPKIVQKYIERPLLLKNLSAKGDPRDLRKFDIRQWVLLTSVDPLKVYVYKKAYLRICGQSYDIRKLDDHIRHLSNWSIQKKEAHGSAHAPTQSIGEQEVMNIQDQNTSAVLLNEQLDNKRKKLSSQGAGRGPHNIVGVEHMAKKENADPGEFVMSVDQFVEKLNNAAEYPELDHSEPHTWEGTFYPQIKQITGDVFHRMAEVFESSGNSFELFGLDFVIDQNLKCWLLEANMSPACAVRKGQEWLTEMTDDMSDGMVNILEHQVLKTYQQQRIELQGPLQDKLEALKNKTYEIDLKNWEKIQVEKQVMKKSANPVPVQASLSPIKRKGGPGNFKSLQKQSLDLADLDASVHHDKAGLGRDPFEIRGHRVNLKNERKVYKKYRKWCAALFIQRVFRGSRARQGLKKLLAVREMALTLERFGRDSRDDEDCLYEGFVAISKRSWEEKYKGNLEQVVRIQRWCRKFFCDGSGEMDNPYMDIRSQTSPRAPKAVSIENSRHAAHRNKLNQDTFGAGPATLDQEQHRSLQIAQDQTPAAKKKMVFLAKSKPYSKDNARLKHMTAKQKQLFKTQTAVYSNHSAAQPGFSKKKSQQRQAKAFKQEREMRSTINSSKSRQTTKSWHASDHGPQDPNLLLNPGPLHIQMIIPTPGKYFKLEGGLTLKRSNSDNPVEVLERAAEREKRDRERVVMSLLQQIKAGKLQGKNPEDLTAALNMSMTNFGSNGSGGNAALGSSPWLSKKMMPSTNLSVYDIYTKGIPSSGFKGDSKGQSIFGNSTFNDFAPHSTESGFKPGSRGGNRANASTYKNVFGKDFQISGGEFTFNQTTGFSSFQNSAVMNRINNYYQVVAPANNNVRAESQDHALHIPARKKNDSTGGQGGHISITSADTCSFDGEAAERPIARQQISRSQNPQMRRFNDLQPPPGASPYLQPQLMLEKEALSLPSNNCTVQQIVTKQSSQKAFVKANITGKGVVSKARQFSKLNLESINQTAAKKASAATQAVNGFASNKGQILHKSYVQNQESYIKKLYKR